MRDNLIAVKLAATLRCIAVACLLACGTAPPPAAPPAGSADAGPPEDAQAPPSAEADASIPVIAIPEPPPPPSTTMSYEEATSTPEPAELHDDRLQLTDAQLHGPMRGVISQCRVPPNAKVTIKTAVQFGRAIGVTVLVDLNKPKPKPVAKPKRLTKAQAKAVAAAAKAEAQMIAKIKSCADHAVRALTWPPSRRRDAFTTTF